MKLVSTVVILIICYMIQKILFMKYWQKGLDAEVHFSRDYIECGESAEIVEVISNDKFLPLPVFHMKFSVDKSLVFDNLENSRITDLYHKNELFSVMGHQRITRKHSFTGTRRGIVSVNNASVLVRDYFMTESYAALVYHSDVIYVFPRKIRTDKFEMFFSGMLGEIETRRSLLEDNLTFRGIREYQSFDPYRSINWKQSAKAGELMVNMYGFSTDSRVKILLNMDCDNMIESEKLLEEAISFVSSIARSLLEKGINVSVRSNGTHEGRLLPEIREGAEIKHAVTIDRMLTEINGSEKKDVFLKILRDEMSHVKSDIYYLVVSPYARADLLELLDRMNADGAVLHLVVPCYDEYPYIPNRRYASEWEVPINV